MLLQKLQMSCQRQCFPTPVAKAEQCADADSAKAARVAALRTFQPPVEVLLRAGGMQIRILGAVIGLLVDDQSFRTGLHHPRILGRFHRSNFNADGGNKRANGFNARLKVTVRYELRVLASDQQDIAEPLIGEVPGFLDHLINTEGHPEDGVVP